MECTRPISIEMSREGTWWEGSWLTINLRTARGCWGDSLIGIIITTSSRCQPLKTIWVDTITHSHSSNTSLRLRMKITVRTKEWILYSITRDLKWDKMISLLLILRKFHQILIALKAEWISEGDQWQKWKAASHSQDHWWLLQARERQDHQACLWRTISKNIK